MKIIKIRFKNLNSLAGEWEIDLSQPAYSGLFSITGPTGAGKSTIMDAICLGLYGKTPRLSKVTISTNEIMSRRTSECFAEVVFETMHGKYRCHWSQRRARDRADGALQAPRHEISDDISGIIIEEKIKTVAKEIEKITGMDFDRFTRSMLLAQGGFAVFLQSSPDDRGPILEQITGTGIYTDISKAVHELKGKRKAELDLLERGIEGIILLSREEIEEFDKKLSELSKKKDQEDMGLQLCNGSIEWLKNIENLKKQLEAINQDRHKILEQIDNFRESGLKLERHEKAIQIKGEYSELKSLRKQQAEDENSMKESADQLTDAKKRSAEMQNRVESLNKELADIRDKVKEFKVIVKEVRELDTQLRGKNEYLQGMIRDKEAIERSIRGKEKEKNLCEDKIRSLGSELNKALDYIEEHAQDENLTRDMAGIIFQLNGLQKLKDDESNKHKECINAKGSLKKAEENLSKCRDDLEKAEKLHSENSSDFASKKNELNALLRGKDLSYWQELLSGLKEMNIRLRLSNEAKKKEIKNKDLISKLNAESIQALKSIDNYNKIIPEKEAEAAELADKIERQGRIQGLEEHRSSLKDGEPCPLCGALEHPYTCGVVEKTDLIKAKKELDYKRKDISDLKIALERGKNSTENINKEIKRLSGEIDELQESIIKDEERLTAEVKKIEETDQIVKDSIGKTREIDKLTKIIEKEKEEINKLKNKTRDAEYKEKEYKGESDRLIKELSKIKEQIEDAEQNTLSLLRRYGINELALTHGEIVNGLEFRDKRWKDYSGKRSKLESEIKSLETKLEGIQEQILQENNTLKNKEIDLKALEDGIKALEDKRYQKFGNKDTDEEEKKIDRSLSDKEDLCRNEEKKLEKENKSLSILSSRIETLQKSIDKRRADINELESSFYSILREKGFKNEEDFSLSILDDNIYSKLKRDNEYLNNQIIVLNIRYNDKKEELENKQKENKTQESLEKLEERYKKIKENIESFQTEIGAIKEKLNSDSELRQQKQSQLAEAEEKRKDFMRWDLLHSLIGSADGKKYRSFVQGLTLEMLIDHANQHLAKMMERYLLTRDEDEDLGLRIVDNYQGGEIRSTMNLSGGESFVVSLALALGLSGISSRNVPIDSLFLDEGFGSLDEDSLETAIETLSELQQDGKLIGIISHVPALKERIAVQIQVIPHSDGRSILKGPGCRKRK